MSISSLYCTRCNCIVLKSGVGVVVEESSELMTDQGAVETVASWIAVEDMFSFENVAFSRDHKSLEGGGRLLTCAGCEKGIFGKAVKKGDGPEAKFESLIDPSRLKAK
jgi:hypothetical protein